MCRKNQEQETETQVALPRHSPTHSKNNQEKKVYKNILQEFFKVYSSFPALHPPVALSGSVQVAALGSRPCPAWDRWVADGRTDRRGTAWPRPSLNREVKTLNKLKEQINNTDLSSVLSPREPSVGTKMPARVVGVDLGCSGEECGRCGGGPRGSAATSLPRGQALESAGLPGASRHPVQPGAPCGHAQRLGELPTGSWTQAGRPASPPTGSSSGGPRQLAASLRSAGVRPRGVAC